MEGEIGAEGRRRRHGDGERERATLSAPRTSDSGSRGGARPSVAPWTMTSFLAVSRGLCDVEVTGPLQLKVGSVRWLVASGSG